MTTIPADLPGCGRKATTQVEMYSPRETLHGSLDGSLYTCDEHADPARDAISAAGLTPYSMPVSGPKRCGDGYDFIAGNPLHAPTSGWPPPGDDPAARHRKTLDHVTRVTGWLEADIIHAARDGDRLALRGLLSALPVEVRLPWVHTLVELGPNAGPRLLADMARDAAHRQVSALRFHLCAGGAR